MANTTGQLDRCAEEAVSQGIAILTITEDGQVTPAEVRDLRLVGRALLTLGGLLDRVAVGWRVVEQIMRLGLDQAPNERLLRHIRQLQRQEHDE